MAWQLQLNGDPRKKQATKKAVKILWNAHPFRRTDERQAMTPEQAEKARAALAASTGKSLVEAGVAKFVKNPCAAVDERPPSNDRKKG